MGAVFIYPAPVRAGLPRMVRACLLAAAATFVTSAFCNPVGDALDRPALAVRDPARVVLLAGAQAGERSVAVGERGVIALSDDGGRKWRQAPAPTSVTLTAVRFAADGRHGLAVGHGGIVLATEDGGEHWTRRLDGRGIAELVLRDARARGDALAIKEAERLVADGADKPLLDVLQLDAQRAIVVGAYGYVLATDDGGASWASWMPRLDNPKGLHLYTIRGRADAILIAGEQGLALLSRDGGKSFHRLETPYKGSFFTAELPADRQLVLAGLRGNVLRSDDDGAAWSSIASPMPVSITASTLSRDGRLLLANQAGFVLSLLGDRLVPVTEAALPPLNAVLTPVQGGLLALSVQGALPVSLPGTSK